MKAWKANLPTSRRWTPHGWMCLADANVHIKINTQKWQVSGIPTPIEANVQPARSTAQGAELLTTGTCKPLPWL